MEMEAVAELLVYTVLTVLTLERLWSRFLTPQPNGRLDKARREIEDMRRQEMRAKLDTIEANQKEILEAIQRRDL